jgi:asparagine synthase (glutamine-hydrolysing)
MLSRQVHRGPDDEHAVRGEEFVLGARRLAIVGLSTGRQPMANEDGTIVACQNGEIYNFPELRPLLASRGHRLRTECDTEVLPHLWEDHGPELTAHIDGMFAVAVWDRKKREGMLARDRCGKKPLYWMRHAGALWWASEAKSLLCVPGFTPKLNLEALHHYLSYKHVPSPLSIFQGVSMLPPGSRLRLREGCEPVVERYWRLSFAPDPELADYSERDLVDRLLDLLKQGVEKRLMADVPIGFFLSGGIDSTLSTVLAAEMIPGRIKTFTLAYEGGSSTQGKDQDRHWAEWAARKWGTDHHVEVISQGDFPEAFRRILTHFDEPFSGVTSTYFLSQLISKHVKVALAGDGADELMASYLSHRLAGPLARHDDYLRTGQDGLIRPFEKQPEFLARLASSHDWQWRAKLLTFTESDKAELYSPDVPRIFDTVAHLRGYFTGLTAREPVNRVLEAEFNGFFPDQVLAFVDRLSMAHSLEVRSAFLDTRLITYLASLPDEWKMREGCTKYLLKQAALRYFPPEMVHRPKEGFVLPINGWLMTSLKEYVRDTLTPRRLSAHGLFRPDVVARWLDDFHGGQAGMANKVLSLLAFQEWFDLYRPSVAFSAGQRLAA